MKDWRSDQVQSLPNGKWRNGKTKMLFSPSLNLDGLHLCTLLHCMSNIFQPHSSSKLSDCVRPLFTSSRTESMNQKFLPFPFFSVLQEKNCKPGKVPVKKVWVQLTTPLAKLTPSTMQCIGVSQAKTPPTSNIR